MQLEIKGNKWQLSWGSGALESLCNDLGISLQDIEYAVLDDDTTLLNKLTYAALTNGAEIMDISLDFNYKYFLAWLDEQPQEMGVEIMNDFMKSKYLGKTMEDRFNEIIERINASAEANDPKTVKKKNTRSVKS